MFQLWLKLCSRFPWVPPLQRLPDASRSHVPAGQRPRCPALREDPRLLVAGAGAAAPRLQAGRRGRRLRRRRSGRLRGCPEGAPGGALRGRRRRGGRRPRRRPCCGRSRRLLPRRQQGRCRGGEVREVLAAEDHDGLRRPGRRQGHPGPEDRRQARHPAAQHRRHAPRGRRPGHGGGQEGPGHHEGGRPRGRLDRHRDHLRPHQARGLQQGLHSGWLPPDPGSDEGPRRDAGGDRRGRDPRHGLRRGQRRSGGAHLRPLDGQGERPVVPREVLPAQVDEAWPGRQADQGVHEGRPVGRRALPAPRRHGRGPQEAPGLLLRRDGTHPGPLQAQGHREDHRRRQGDQPGLGGCGVQAGLGQ
mmetsp:Transcript_32988/g.71965  ORF Transcript_32988/g.71965 Transcript_32988/m.71965 type:complete len:359 (-) Transcript_32988:245-1321(-)